MPNSYIGRFAPSPTGPLHFGSLVAALASYLDAKAQQGRWLVRIEDIDNTRCFEHFSQSILTTLEHFGLYWDGEVVYQSQRDELYQHRLQQLIDLQLAFACSCSRKQLDGRLHHGRCQPVNPNDFAWRFLCPSQHNGHEQYCFTDRLQGLWCEHLVHSLDDFVLKRRDHLWAYQLAVVTDDIEQQITHVVRGIDLIDSTARQGLIYQALNQTPPSYAHLPVSVELNGQKLSKQNLAKPLMGELAADTLFLALEWLQQSPPQELHGSIDELLQWAIAHWQIEKLQGIQQLPTPCNFRHAE